MSYVRKRITLFDAVLFFIILVLSVIFIFPVIMTAMTSVSDPKLLMANTVWLKPYGFTLESYRMLLQGSEILRYYGNTILYAGIGTVIMLLVTSTMAYPLLYRDFRGSGLITVLLVITMFFSGGMVASYINIIQLKMLDSIWAMVLPSAVSAYNVIVFRTFFRNIPDSLAESAVIDGAGHFRVLFSIMLPLSKALLATFALFSIVGYWNDYMTALLYLPTDKKWPIQMFLRKILVLVELSDTIDNFDIVRSLASINTRTIQSAAIMITIIPILCVYPFLQKYFAQGVMIGAIKG